MVENEPGQWGGVENQNPRRQDSLMGAERSRSRSATLLANLAVIRSGLLQVIVPLETQSLPQLRE